MDTALELSDDEYGAAFRVFKNASTERELLAVWFERALARMALSTESVSVLSIGGGNGELDIRFIHSILKRYDSVHYHVVEPYGLALRAFERRAEALGSSHLHLTTDQSTFESYTPDRNFDLCHSIHSLIYMENPLHELLRALKMAGGRAMFVNQNMQGISALRHEFFPMIGQSGTGTLTSEDISRTLKNAGCHFEEEVLPGSVDVTPCFDQESQTGLLLMNFFLLCRFDQLATKLREQVLSKLQDVSLSEDGRRILANPVAAFQVS